MLRDVAGKPLVERVVDRARRIRSVHELVVAATVEDADDALAEHCRSLGLPVFRGPSANVAQRVRDCADAHGWSHFARINADSPFFDPELIDTAMQRLVHDVRDLVTNVAPRSYPYGVTVEVFRTNAFRRAYRWMTHPDDLEHVSRYFYRHGARFRIGYLPPADGDYTDVRLTVDTEDDLQRAALLIQRLGSAYETSSWSQIVATYRECWPEASAQRPELARI